MAVTSSIITPIKGMKEAQRNARLMPGVADKAIVSALNKLARQGMTAGRKAITTTYTIKAKDVTPAVKLTKATRSRQVAVIHAVGSSLPLFKFSGLPRQPISQAGKKAPYKGRRRASAKVKRQGQRTKLQHAFVATMGNNTSIYERTGAGRLPVRQVPGPGIPQMFKVAATKAIDRLVKDKGEAIFRHELEFFAKKAGVTDAK